MCPARRSRHQAPARHSFDPPFPHQPGSGLQLRASAYRGCSGFLEQLCNPEQLALRSWAEAAPGEFLQPVCDSLRQQLATEVSGRLSLVETAPLPTQFADVELGEARERLPIDSISPGGLADRGRRLARFRATRGVVDGKAHGFAGAPMR